MSGLMGVMLLMLTGCRPVPWAYEEAPEVSEGRRQVREEVARAPSRSSLMEMPDWYRELLREVPVEERQPDRIYEDIGTVRGYW